MWIPKSIILSITQVTWCSLLQLNVSIIWYPADLSYDFSFVSSLQFLITFICCFRTVVNCAEQRFLLSFFCFRRHTLPVWPCTIKNGPVKRLFLYRQLTFFLGAGSTEIHLLWCSSLIHIALSDLSQLSFAQSYVKWNIKYIFYSSQLDCIVLSFNLKSTEMIYCILMGKSRLKPQFYFCIQYLLWEKNLD